MPLYQNRFSGVTASGDTFVFSWWTFTAETSTVAMKDFAVTWANDLWNGPTGTDGYGSLVTSGVAMQRVAVGEIDIPTGTQQTLSDETVSLAGTATGNAMPADVAWVVSLRTALANRRGRGRFYLPQPAASNLTTDGRVLTASVTTLMGALSNAWANYNVAKSPVIYSRTNRATQDVTTYNVGDLFDTQRRRENALTEVRDSATMP